VTKPLSRNEMRARAVTFAARWKDESSEKSESQTFWTEFLDIYGVDRKRVAAFEQLAKRTSTGNYGFIDLYWPGVLIAEQKTTQANATVGRIHDRMPVMLRDQMARSIWLDGGAHLDDVAALLGPAPEEYLVPRRVSRLVSNARNEGPECLAEAGVEGLGLV